MFNSFEEENKKNKSYASRALWNIFQQEETSVAFELSECILYKSVCFWISLSVCEKNERIKNHKENRLFLISSV